MKARCSFETKKTSQISWSFDLLGCSAFAEAHTTKPLQLLPPLHPRLSAVSAAIRERLGLHIRRVVFIFLELLPSASLIWEFVDLVEVARSNDDVDYFEHSSIAWAADGAHAKAADVHSMAHVAEVIDSLLEDSNSNGNECIENFHVSLWFQVLASR